MKAIRIHQHGGIDQLHFEDSPDPELKSPHDAIIKLRAASLNYSDIEIRRGVTDMELPLPHILGSDGAGTVVAVGSKVKHIKTGDSVCLYPLSGCGKCKYCVADRDFMCNQARVLGKQDKGTYAEYVGVAARNCFAIPAGLSFGEAAACPVVFITLWRMLITNAALKPGESVLIRGVGADVATAALQLATHRGAHIIVTSNSEKNLALAKKLGADHGINDSAVDFAKEVRGLTNKRGVDVVVDCIGGDGWMTSLASLARGGRLVTCGAMAGSQPQTNLQRIFWNHLKVFGSTLGTRDEFYQVLKFLDGSGTKPVIDKMLPLQEAAMAQRRMEEGLQFGKIVLTMDR